jgi:hypothetical protein
LNETINEVVTLEKDLDSFAKVFPKPPPMVGKTTFNNNNDKQKLSFACNTMFDAIDRGSKMLVALMEKSI